MDPQTKIAHRLEERIKELTALHQASEILQASNKDTATLLREFAQILPPAWQYPHLAVVRMIYDQVEFSTSDFFETQWRQEAFFTTTSGKNGKIEVCYRDFCPLESEGPFLQEERSLIDSLSKMLCSYFNRKEFEDELKQANQELESRVKQRTLSLRRLTSKLLFAEERQRRSIATDLHDHVGQTLAMIRCRLMEMQSKPELCGLESDVKFLLGLIEQTISYTRSLTIELTPPMLYELGLDAALEWLVEQINTKHTMMISFTNDREHRPLADDIKIALYKSVNELLMNVVKHAQTQKARVAIRKVNNTVQITVEDQGQGFDTNELRALNKKCFGLFSIKERVNDLGGGLELTSQKGQGTRAVITAKCFDSQ